MSLIPFADQEQVISSSPVLDPLKVDPSLAALTIVSVSAEAVTPGPLDVGATISAPIQPVSRAPTPDELRARYSEIPSHASEWFVVTQGRMPGVYHTWDETLPFVIGVSCAVYKKWETKEEALAAYGSAWALQNLNRL